MQKKTADRCAQFLKIIADRERLQIVSLLHRQPRNVTQLADEMNKPIANVSHHLKVMRAAGLIIGDKEGKFVTYRLASEYFGAASESIDGCCLNLGCCQVDLSPTA